MVDRLMAQDDVNSQDPPAQAPVAPSGESVAKELSEAVRGSGAVVLPTAPADGIDPVAHMDGAPASGTSSQDAGSPVQADSTGQSSSTE